MALSTQCMDGFDKLRLGQTQSGDLPNPPNIIKLEAHLLHFYQIEQVTKQGQQEIKL